MLSEGRESYMNESLAEARVTIESGRFGLLWSEQLPTLSRFLDLLRVTYPICILFTHKWGLGST